MTFEGKYFDGQTNTAYPAKIAFTNSALFISYAVAGSQRTVEWLPKKIRTNDLEENRTVVLKYGDSPTQYLEVSDPSFVSELKASFPDARFQGSFFSSSGFIGLAVLAAAVVALLVLIYTVVLPLATERFAASVPIEWEKQLGEAGYKSMVTEASIDKENTARINEFFHRLNYPSKYEIEITVVKEEVVNAFALPGGKIVVYRGILNKMSDYKELVALLSHEFSHVELKHTTKSMISSMSSSLLLSWLLGDASGLTGAMIEQADELKQLGYSRSLEEEADLNGLRLMKVRKLDAAGMKGLFETLKKEEGAAGSVPEFLSTHPLTANRIKAAEKEIAENPYAASEDSTLDSLFTLLKAKN